MGLRRREEVAGAWGSGEKFRDWHVGAEGPEGRGWNLSETYPVTVASVVIASHGRRFLLPPLLLLLSSSHF